MPWLPTLSRPFHKGRAPFSVPDLIVGVGVVAVLSAMLWVARGMTEPAVPESLEIDLDPVHIPYYLLRSTARMFIAYSWALAFTFTYGSLAAHSRRAERILMPLLDILQSVPVLGFLSVTVTAFMSLFPGSLLGLELASIFAIFTSQAWNMAYSFFQSVRAIPRDLAESAAICGLSPFQRFARLEVPSAMNGLVWNSMVSFGGGWFFLAASEAITVLGQDLRLPGIGSYLATAVEAADWTAITLAILSTIGVIVLLDLMFFRPLLAWAQKFGSSGELDDEYESSVLTWLQRSHLVERFQERVLDPAVSFVVHRIPALLADQGRRSRLAMPRRIRPFLGWGLAATLVLFLLYWGGIGAYWIATETSPEQLLEVVLAGMATLARVAATVIVSSLIWVPVGTYIGSRPALARRLRPIIQLGAAFPANLVFPLLVLAFSRLGVDISWGSVLLMVLATQWYILFNVIVGTLSIPTDLREVAGVLALSRWQRFRYLTVPVVFPYWVTGSITAAGGAWNASIVAEVATLGDTTLSSFGLGAYMTRATGEGDWSGIILSIVTMCVFVVAMNRLVWRQLYVFAEDRLKEE